MALALNPVNIFNQGAMEERAETARLSSFVGAVAVGDLVKSTLGPKGMDKILLNPSGAARGEPLVTVTNDGATILRQVGLDNPAAKILQETAKVQDDEVGDGTTSVTVLTAELLREAEKLVAQKLHPQTIVAGYRKANAVALAALENSVVDNGADPEKFAIDLMNVARTTLSSKLLTQHKDFFSKMAVDAVMRLHGNGDLNNIQLIKKLGGCMTDSFLAEGFILQKTIGVNQPKRIENARILLANTAMDTDKIKIFGSKVRVDQVSKVQQIEQAEKDKMKGKVQKIVDHNINVFINRQLIYNYPEQLFADNGIMAIEHADFEGIERLAKVLGGEIVSTFERPDKVKLGKCAVIEECIVGEDRYIKFSGVEQGEACTIVLRGATNQILEEADRSLHDCLCVLTQTVKNTKTVLGGGCSEMLMANAVRDLAKVTEGKEAFAIEAFANALQQLPTIIADNGGFDSNELMTQLRAKHAKQEKTMGLDMEAGSIECVSKLGITESYMVKRRVVNSAASAAEMILRVDNILSAAPRQRGGDQCQ